MSRILVTGATGFVGGHLLDRLRGRGDVTAWYRKGARPAQTSPDIEWRAVDITSRAIVTKAVAKAAPSQIYHLAGETQVDTSWRNVTPHLRTNVLGTAHLLDAVRRLARPCRVLVVTSSQIYQAGGDPPLTPLTEDAPLLPSSPYGLSKLAQDELAMRAFAEDGLDIVVARPFNHAGPRQGPNFVISSFARQIAMAEAGQVEPELRVGNLDAQRDLTDVRDVVDAYERLMAGGTAGRAYNIASGRAQRMGELLDILLAAARTSVRVVVDQDRMRPNDHAVTLGDASRARAEVAWAPEIPIATTLADTLSWWREEIARSV